MEQELKGSYNNISQGNLWQYFYFWDDEGTNVGYCNLDLLLEKLQKAHENPLLCLLVNNLLAIQDMKFASIQ